MFRCSRENSRNAGTKYLVEKTRSVPLNVRDCAPCRGAERIAIYPPLNGRAGAHELDRLSFVARQTSKRLSNYE